MIPKRIHYCWYGGNPLSELAEKCITSWKKYCPDYEIIQWDESNTDLKTNSYVREAYASRKWAFITDYVRLKVLYDYGGIYMDTDVEVIKNIDCFLQKKGFSGFEREDAVPTGIMAAEKGHPFIGELLREYDSIHFIKDDGSMDLTTNVVRITDAAKTHGLKLNDSEQIIEGFTFYPKDYFCPKSPRTYEVRITKNTYTIHHFAGSWNTKRTIRSVIKRVLPNWTLKRMVQVMDFLHIK